MDSATPIRDASDTAPWMAQYRAMENGPVEAEFRENAFRLRRTVHGGRLLSLIPRLQRKRQGEAM